MNPYKLHVNSIFVGDWLFVLAFWIKLSTQKKGNVE